ncbi:MAG: lycopene beta-cyclase CrtY [Janthinobacterium lividum]
MTYDVILAGGGLANGLIAWRLRQLRPELNILCLEQHPELGGNHTWSFNDGDIDRAQQQWLEPLVIKRWPSYQVHFPGISRSLTSGYASISSERFAEVVGSALGPSLRLSATIIELQPTQVRLDTGETLKARIVIDGRGAHASPHHVLGRQAFLGQQLRLERPHGLTAPIIMDARVTQADGYRFVYVLPFSADTVLVEDTHYVDQQRLGPDQLRGHIAEYVRLQGWTVSECLREEQGSLPIILAGDFNGFWDATGDQPLSGLRAGLFHCTTGYSLPHAVRLAEWVAAQPLDHVATFADGLRAHARDAWHQQRFYRLLNRMLFLAGRPEDRWQVMQRFYRLPDDLIARFYAGDNTWTDRARVLLGKPPVPIGEALQAAVRYAPQHFPSQSPESSS